MPLPNQGVVPASGGLYNELTAVTRRAFVRRLYVQLYFATPTLFYLLGNAQRSAGGVNQITVPVQGQSMVQGQFTGYGGGFNSPVVTPGIQNAQFSVAYWVVPVPLPFGETILQATEREISILRARMNDVWSVTVQNMGGLLYTNNSANSLFPSGFPEAFDDSTNVATYGGINRTTAGNAFWKSQYYNASALSAGFTRKTMSQYLIQITDAAGGEAPTFVVMNPSDFATLNSDFIGVATSTTSTVETYMITPGKEFSMGTPIRSGFPNLNICGVPVFMDHWCPKGSLFAVNMKYTSMYMDENASFDFSGFESLIPLGQIGQQGVVVTGYQTVCAKPVSGAQVTGFAGGAF